MNNYILVMSLLFSLVSSSVKAEDIHLLCHQASESTGVGYKNFETSKIERFEDNEKIVFEVQGDSTRFATISCEVDPPVNMHTNISFTTNNWGRLRVSSTPNSGSGESIFLFNPKHNMAIYAFVVSVRGTTDGWGVVYQSMYRCKEQLIENYSDVCGESLTSGSSGPANTPLRSAIADH
jgi:hypothetical protein